MTYPAWRGRSVLLLRYAAETSYPRSGVLRTLIGPGTLAGDLDYLGFYENHFAESRITRGYEGFRRKAFGAGWLYA